MVGEMFEVYEIDECGSAWIEKWWDGPASAFRDTGLKWPHGGNVG
jgi:hypothetical protein